MEISFGLEQNVCQERSESMDDKNENRKKRTRDAEVIQGHKENQREDSQTVARSWKKDPEADLQAEVQGQEKDSGADSIRVQGQDEDLAIDPKIKTQGQNPDSEVDLQAEVQGQKKDLELDSIERVQDPGKDAEADSVERVQDPGRNAETGSIGKAQDDAKKQAGDAWKGRDKNPQNQNSKENDKIRDMQSGRRVRQKNDKLIQEDVFQSRREKYRAIEKKRRQKRRRNRILALLAIACLLGLVYLIQTSRCDYYKYKSETDTEENEGVSYETFANGYIKYSENGIMYLKKFENSSQKKSKNKNDSADAVWNVALSMNQPFIAKTDHYILIADKGGVEFRLFDVYGEVMEDKMPYPIVQIDVSDNGTVLAILKGDDCSYLRIIDISKKVIADTQISLNETGYPLAAAISPDGTKLAVSYYTIDNLKSQTDIKFYDLTRQIQAGSDPCCGLLKYSETLIPKMKFITKNRIVAFANDATYYLEFGDSPKERSKIEFQYDIESVFTGDDYFGYVCDNDDLEEGRYRLFLYDKKGRKKMEKTIDMNYDKIFMVGSQIIATKDNVCTIIDKHGNILFQGELEGGHIVNVLPCFGWRTYFVVFGSKIEKMQLSFFE